MGPNWTRGKGEAPPLPFPTPSLFPSFFSPTPERKRGILLGLGSPSRTPYFRHAPPRPASSSSLLYIRGQGTPQRDTKPSLSRVRWPPPQLHTSVISL